LKKLPSLDKDKESDAAVGAHELGDLLGTFLHLEGGGETMALGCCYSCFGSTVSGEE
jgi:hypothetical protein